MTDTARFWSRFAARYDGRVLSRDAAVLAPRIAQAVGAVDRVLDAGCGTGHVTVELARVARQVDATDFAEEMLDVARKTTAALGLANTHFQRMSRSMPSASPTAPSTQWCSRMFSIWSMTPPKSSRKHAAS